MENEKKRSRRGINKYVDYYSPNAAGEYVYTGDYYEYASDNKKSYTQVCVEYLILACILFAAVIADGCYVAPGTISCWYVKLSYIFSLFSAIWLGWKSVKFLTQAIPMKEYIYEETARRIPAAALVFLICAAAAVLAEIIFLILNGAEDMAGRAVLYLGLEILAAVCAFFVRRQMIRSHWILSKK